MPSPKKPACPTLPATSSAPATACVTHERKIRIFNLAGHSVMKCIDSTRIFRVKHLNALEFISCFFDESQKLPPLHRVKWLAVKDGAAATPSASEEEAVEVEEGMEFEGFHTTGGDRASKASSSSNPDVGFLDPDDDIPPGEGCALRFVIVPESGGLTPEKLQCPAGVIAEEWIDRNLLVNYGEDRHGDHGTLYDLTLEQARSFLYDGLYAFLPNVVAGGCVPCDENMFFRLSLENTTKEQNCERTMSMRMYRTRNCMGYSEPFERWENYWNIVRAVFELPQSEWIKHEAETGGKCFRFTHHRKQFARELLKDLLCFNPAFAPQHHQEGEREGIYEAIIAAAEMNAQEYAEWLTETLLKDEWGNFGLVTGWRTRGQDGRLTLSSGRDPFPEARAILKLVVRDVMRTCDQLEQDQKFEDGDTFGAAADDKNLIRDFCETITNPFRVENLSAMAEIRATFVPVLGRQIGISARFFHLGSSVTTNDLLQEIACVIGRVKQRLQNDLRSVADDLQFFQDEFTKLGFQCNHFPETIAPLRELVRSIGTDHDVQALDKFGNIRKEFETYWKNWIRDKKPRTPWNVNWDDVAEMWKVHDLPFGDTSDEGYESEELHHYERRRGRPSYSSLKSYHSAFSTRKKQKAASAAQRQAWRTAHGYDGWYPRSSESEDGVNDENRNAASRAVENEQEDSLSFRTPQSHASRRS
ncbi:unnamed protein product [Amoebophrya sp. A120]|nr:unnamed protein product [Amoebophrya sp. A120]|eukprot:GSA120T00011308001.1